MRQIYKLSEKVAEFGEDQQRIISETLLPAKLGNFLKSRYKKLLYYGFNITETIYLAILVYLNQKEN